MGVVLLLFKHKRQSAKLECSIELDVFYFMRFLKFQILKEQFFFGIEKSNLKFNTQCGAFEAIIIE